MAKKKPCKVQITPFLKFQGPTSFKTPLGFQINMLMDQKSEKSIWKMIPTTVGHYTQRVQ